MRCWGFALMLDADPQAAARFVRAVGAFSRGAVPTTPGVIWREITPDEQLNMPLLARRIYGDNAEWLVCATVCGVAVPDAPARLGRYAFPNKPTLASLKRQAGFETQPAFRNADGSPSWGG